MLGKNASDTITPGAGLSMSAWAKNPAKLAKFGIDPSTLIPQLEEMRRVFGKNFPNANIWVFPGAKTP